MTQPNPANCPATSSEARGFPVPDRREITPRLATQHMIIDLHSHAVRSRKFFYGPQEKVGIAFVGTLAECKAWVAASDSATYYTSNNESGRWSLKIVTTNSLSPLARTEAAHKQMEQAA